MEVCKICGKECKIIGNHLKKHKLSGKEYYDEFFKIKGEGICKVCLKETKYQDLKSGYRKYCSIRCRCNDKDYWYIVGETRSENQNEINQKYKKTCLEKYGVENTFQLEVVKSKSKKTMLERYGVDHNMFIPDVVKRIKETSYKKYGVECVLNLDENKEKAKRRKRMVEENSGKWIPLDLKSDLELYRIEVWKITRNNLKKIYGDWDGRDYYTGEYVEINKKLKNTSKYKSVDHKISILNGFKNNISPHIIGGIENLCICTRGNNSMKRERNEDEFVYLLKERGIIK